MRPIDIEHLGRRNSIAVWQVEDVLIDCGPASTVDRLLSELGDWRPRKLLLTHIHLDHAGAAGQLAERFDDLEVYVHEIGAPHLVDPTRLMRSVRRIYGEDTDRQWGEMKPVPERQLRPLRGREQLGSFEAAYTPGHASHHVAFLHQSSGRVFAGDAAGVRIMPERLIMPHAPPPDIDLPAWKESLDRIAAWRPTSLALPHFGVVGDAEEHLAAVWERLNEKAELASVADLDEFVTRSEEELQGLEPEMRDVYRQTSPAEHMYLGLRRFWEKHGEEPDGSATTGAS
jgi:glyoxylase-like metal-dependent hydrolase (beta-lactamase superfamily II)